MKLCKNSNKLYIINIIYEFLILIIFFSLLFSLDYFKEKKYKRKNFYVCFFFLRAFISSKFIIIIKKEVKAHTQKKN